jgi:hypothetical protein
VTGEKVESESGGEEEEGPKESGWEGGFRRNETRRMETDVKKRKTRLGRGTESLLYNTNKLWCVGRQKVMIATCEQCEQCPECCTIPDYQSSI